jgi:pimeloyl-[acyl-carrier protein] methyl ester esterase
MKPIQIVFCHGWGMDKNFWQPLLKYFRQYNCIYWDLGYFGKEEKLAPNFKDFDVIAIGHSLGALKLLEYSPKFKAAIILQGFVNFLGNNPDLYKKRKLEWQKMCSSFNSDPQKTLEQFYKRVYGEQESSLLIDQKELNLERLNADLNYLTTLLSLPKYKILVVGSWDDKIVPPILLADNFTSSQIIMHEKANHSIITMAPDFTAAAIKNFLYEAKN